MGRLFALRPPRPPWHADRWFAIAGIVCLVVSVTGQAFSWGGAQLGGITSPLTRVITFALGLGLVIFSFLVQVGGDTSKKTHDGSVRTEDDSKPNNDQMTTTGTPSVGADPSHLAATLTGTTPRLLLDSNAEFVGEPTDVTAAVVQILERIDLKIEPLYEFAMKDADQYAARFRELEALGSARTKAQSDERLFHVQATKKWLEDKRTFERAARIGLRAQQIGFFQTARPGARPYMSPENLTDFILGLRDVMWNKEARDVEWWLWRKTPPSMLRVFGLLEDEAKDMEEHPPIDTLPAGLQSWGTAYWILHFGGTPLWRRILPNIALEVTRVHRQEASDATMIDLTNLELWQFSLDDPRRWNGLPDY